MANRVANKQGGEMGGQCWAATLIGLYVNTYIHPVDVTHTNIVCMYLAVWYVNTYIQFSDVLCIQVQFFHKPPSGVGSVMK